MQLLKDINHRKQSHFGPSKFCKTRKAYNEKKNPETHSSYNEKQVL